MSSSGTIPNGDPSNSDDSDTLKDEIGDDSILNRLDSEDSDLKNIQAMKISNKIQPLNVPRVGTQVEKTGKIGDLEEDDKGSYLNMPTESNFVRRGTVFESLIGGFGSMNIGEEVKEKVPMIGGTSSKKFLNLLPFLCIYLIYRWIR